jgi:hypothetical protein
LRRGPREEEEEEEEEEHALIPRRDEIAITKKETTLRSRRGDDAFVAEGRRLPNTTTMRV